MTDIRIFMKDSLMYVYDRASIRVGERVLLSCIEYTGLSYNVKAWFGVLPDCSTSLLEESIVRVLSEYTDILNMSFIEVRKLLIDKYGLCCDYVNHLMSVLSSKQDVSDVDHIIKSILSLGYKDRAEVVMRVIDLL